jgi:hypothetical protein
MWQQEADQTANPDRDIIFAVNMMTVRHKAVAWYRLLSAQSGQRWRAHDVPNDAVTRQMQPALESATAKMTVKRRCR